MRKIKAYKDKLYRQKKRYLFLSSIVVVGLITGVVYFLYLSNDNQKLIFAHLETLFETIKNNKIDYSTSIINGIISNLLNCSIIWLLGISIIGIPIVIFILFYHAFVVGLTISSIIGCYKLKGVLVAIIYVFPHKILFLTINVLLVFYSISFSIKLIRYLFFKVNINFKDSFRKYLKILAISLSLFVFLSLYECFVVPFFLKTIV